MSTDTPEPPATAFPDGLRVFLVRAVAGAGVAHLAGMLFTFLVGLQLARGLGVQGYGEYGIAIAVIALASIPGEFGLPRLVIREMAAASAKGDRPRLYGVLRWADRTALLLSLATAAVLAVGAYLFVREEDSAVAWAILVGAPVIPLVALLKIRGAALQGLTFVVRGQLPSELLRPLLFSILLFALFAATPGAGPAEAMALNVVTGLAGLAVAIAWLGPKLPKPRPVTTVQDGRRWFASAVPMALTQGLITMQAQVVILVLGMMLVASDVGLFRIAASTATMVAIATTLLGSVTAPVLARLHAEGDRRRLQALSTRSAQTTTAGVVTLSLPIFFFGPEIIGLLFGAEYRPAYPALVILCLGQIVDSSFGPNASLLVMTGHERRVTRASLVSLILCVALLPMLIAVFGMTGAAIATAAALLMANVLWGYDARRRIGIDTSIFGGAKEGRQANIR